MNYAYVNCVDEVSAKGIVEAVDEKMMLHHHFLKAKIKGHKNQPHSISTSSFQPPRSANSDICTVKVLIYDNSLTGSDIDDYFRQYYGEISSATVVRQGNPIYGYVNFVDPSSAHRARSASPHTIQGMCVVAVPFKTARHGPPVNPTLDLASLEFSCNPLVFSHAKKEILSEFKDQQMTKIDARGDKFVAHVQRPIAELVKNRIESVIAAHETGVESKALKLEFYYLPVLADLHTQKSIHDIKLPCQLRVGRGTEKVDLGELAADYSASNKGPSDLATLDRYLTSISSADSSSKCRWYWFDDATFQPYTERVSEQIEKKFAEKDSLKVGIGRFNYKIDTINMVQINKQSLKKRPIQRKPMHSSDASSHIILYVTAQKDHTSELQREIAEMLSKSIEKASILLPDIVMQEKTFTDVLLGIARRNYVQATLDKDGLATVVLRGKQLLVKNTDVELQKELLKREREMAKMTRVSVPGHWEPQLNKCELKSVVKGSPEWNSIHDKMQHSDFKVDITKMERIQNTWLWEGYQIAKKRMLDKNDGNVNEKILFHGPRQTRPKDIYDSEQGFDHRLAHQGLWGEGTYFAVESKYSHRYAYEPTHGRHQLFLANVITGVACKCLTSDRTLKAPPKKSEQRYGSLQGAAATAKFEGERFDSVNAYTNGSEIYVIYELGRVYPAYLITYTLCNRMVF